MLAMLQEFSKQFLGLLEVFELFLGKFECRRMNTSPATAVFRRMPQVQHFMKQHVLYRDTRNRFAIQDPAQHDRVVRGIIVTQ